MIPFFSLWIFFTLRELAYYFVPMYNYNVSHFELGSVALPIDRIGKQQQITFISTPKRFSTSGRSGPKFDGFIEFIRFDWIWSQTEK